jgi:hypothetical protein
MAVKSFSPPIVVCEMDASMGNSARSVASGLRLPIVRLLKPVSANVLKVEISL